jgi:hypothetical protein
MFLLSRKSVWQFFEIFAKIHRFFPWIIFCRRHDCARGRFFLMPPQNKMDIILGASTAVIISSIFGSDWTS